MYGQIQPDILIVDILLPGIDGATLITTLHHVEMALQHFPRIIGLKDGELAFDLPAGEVTPERLAALYAQHLDELHGAAPEPKVLADAALPAVMHCR